MGRPKSKIDWNKVDNYLKAHCTGTEVAAVLGIHPDTLYLACEAKFNMGFSAYSQQKRENGKALIRAKQFQVAMEGDKTMLIWLGKQELEQKEKQELTGQNGKDLFQSITIELIDSSDKVENEDSSSK